MKTVDITVSADIAKILKSIDNDYRKRQAEKASLLAEKTTLSEFFRKTPLMHISNRPALIERFEVIEARLAELNQK